MGADDAGEIRNITVDCTHCVKVYTDYCLCVLAKTFNSNFFADLSTLEIKCSNKSKTKQNVWYSNIVRQ